jgi:hypothetical protein
MVRTNGTLPYHCYRATSATDARIGMRTNATDPVPLCCEHWYVVDRYSKQDGYLSFDVLQIVSRIT